MILADAVRIALCSIAWICLMILAVPLAVILLAAFALFFILEACHAD